MKSTSPNPAVEVVFVDNHLLVVVKPAGMLSQEDRTGDEDLITWGRAYLKQRFDKPGNVFLGLVQRIDRPASGVMVLARTSKAAQRLTDQFRERSVSKSYLAIVAGDPGREGKWADFLLKRDERVSVVTGGVRGAREARLSWKRLMCAGGQSLVRIKLETGRPHQIRVQFATRGYPLVGDFRYGSSEELDGRNLALHCEKLAVHHPTRPERMTWSAAPPVTWPPEFVAAAC